MVQKTLSSTFGPLISLKASTNYEDCGAPKRELSDRTHRRRSEICLALATGVYESEQIDYLVEKRLTNQAVKRTVSRILRDFGLDERSIDAEALRLSMADITPFDRRITELELRRDRLLRRIEDHRAGLAFDVVAKSDRPFEGDDDHSSDQR